MSEMGLSKCRLYHDKYPISGQNGHDKSYQTRSNLANRAYANFGKNRTYGAEATKAMGHIGHIRIFPVVIYITRQLYVEMSDFCICSRCGGIYPDISY